MVYRGRDHPPWRGVYVFGDHCSGELWALRNVTSTPEIRLLTDTDLTLTAIGTDYHGEILLTDGAGGALYALDFPPVWEAGWVGVEERLGEILLQADRAGYSRTHEQLGALLSSRRYQMAHRIVRFYRWLTSSF